MSISEAVLVTIIVCACVGLVAWTIVDQHRRIKALEEEKKHVRNTHSQDEGLEDLTANIIPYLRRIEADYERAKNEKEWAEKLIRIAQQLRAGPYAYRNQKERSKK